MNQFPNFSIFVKLEIGYEGLEKDEDFKIEKVVHSKLERTLAKPFWFHVTKKVFLCVEISENYAHNTDIITVYRLSEATLKP